MLVPKTVLALALLLPLADCDVPIGTLHPLMTPQDSAVSEPNLVGEWAEPSEKSTTWKFEKAEGSAYRLTVVDRSDESADVFAVRLVRLGGYLFLDAMLEKARVKGEDVDTDGFWVPLHLFGRIDIRSDELHLRLLKEAWLKTALQEKRADLRYERTEDGKILITATTEELQNSARKFAADEKAFSFPMDLSRLKAVVPASIP